MDKNTIVVGINGDNIYACDVVDGVWYYYTELEMKSLLQELKGVHFSGVTVDKNGDVTFTSDDEKILFGNMDKLKEHDAFKDIYLHLKEESDKIVKNAQKEKLKQRKHHRLTRLAAFTMAAFISLPGSVDESLIRSNGFNYIDQYLTLDFENIKDSEFSLGELDTRVLQGICTVGENTFITAYDSSDDRDKSVVYILDKDNNCINEKYLYNNSHVGGICYDDENEIFWITDKNGTISGYTYDALFYDKDEICTPKFKQIDVGSEDLINYQGIPSVGYIAYHKGKIFVGNFAIDGSGILKSFDIKKNGSIDIESCKKAKFFNKVQGISFYEKNDETYLLASVSYGKYSESDLLVLKYDEDCNDYTKKVTTSCKMPPMMEQITFNDNGKLMTLYESNAIKYKTAFRNNSDVVVTNLDKVVDQVFKSL